MEAGAYRYPIKIKHLVTAQTQSGAVEEVWKIVRHTRACVNFRAHSRDTIDNRISYPGRYEMVVRSYCEINNNTRIEWQGKTYRVIDWHEDMEYNDIVMEIEQVIDA